MSFVSSCISDIGRIAAARITLGNAQQKHHVSGQHPSVFNNYEGGIYLSVPFQRPCVSNRALEMFKIADNVFGSHLMVASMSWEGKNLEDSIIIKKESMDMLTVISMSKHISKCSSTSLTSPTPNNLNHNHDKIGDFGLPYISSVLVKGDAIHKNVDQIIKPSDFTTQNYVNISYDNSPPVHFLIPQTVIRISSKGSDNIDTRISMASYKQSRVGDKFTNRSTQKGTFGYIIESDKLPYTSDGIVPDVIAYSTSMLSRKTFNHFIETSLTNLFSLCPLDENGNVCYINYSTIEDTSIEEFQTLCMKRTGDQNFSLTKELYSPYTHK